jgi:uncharacterized protein
LLWEDPGVSHVVLTASFLGVAGIVAGITGTAGGITTLVAYPALLAVGIPPLAANVTNSVAMVGSGLGSTSRAAPDITGQGATIRRWLPVTITMSVAGAVLLVVTPGGIFGRVVPFLVAAGSLILLMLLTAEPVLHRANAVKNVLLAASDILPAVLFAIAGTVVWTAAIPLGTGTIAGGLIGPSIARRVRHDILRVLIACMGLGLATWLFISS